MARYRSPMSEWDQAQLALWIRKHLPKDLRDMLLEELPECAAHIYPIENTNLVTTKYGKVLDLSKVYDALKRGKKIEAIKEYRSISGLGLKEAKEAVDNIEIRGK